MPTPCPSRLKELISRANQEPYPEVRKHLQAIARAFDARRKGKADAPSSIQIETKRTMTVILGDGTVEIPRDELELALDQIEPPSNIDRIRECPCTDIFWASRSDKVACDRHTVAWSKREWRRKAREKAEQRAKAQAERQRQRAERPFELTITTAAILDAIFDNIRRFSKIDWYCWAYLDKHYLAVNVKPSLDLLVAAGFLSCTEQQKENWYFATEKLKRWRRELKGKSFRRAFADGQILPTH